MAAAGLAAPMRASAAGGPAMACVLLLEPLVSNVRGAMRAGKQRVVSMNRQFSDFRGGFRGARAGAACGRGQRQGHLRAPTGSPRPSMAATTRPSPTAPTPPAASTSPSCRAARRSAGRPLLLAGKIDFYMGGNCCRPSTPCSRTSRCASSPPLPEGAAGADVPSRPGARQMGGPEERRRSTSSATRARRAIFQWMVTEFGFDAAKRVPYTFNPAPFIANKKSIQQGYVTSEPFAVEKEGGFKPNLFLLADYGYDTYATTIETHAGRRSTSGRRSSSASSMARPRAGTTISTATTRPPTRRSRRTIPTSPTSRSPSRSSR